MGYALLTRWLDPPSLTQRSVALWLAPKSIVPLIRIHLPSRHRGRRWDPHHEENPQALRREECRWWLDDEEKRLTPVNAISLTLPGDLHQR